MYKKMLSNTLVLKFVAPLLVAILLVVSFLIGKSIIEKKNFSLVLDGITTQYTSRASTIGEALEEANITINEKDKVEPSLDDKLEDGLTVNIKRAVNVTMTADGESRTILTAEDTVADMLQAEGITLGEQDRLNYAQDDPVSEAMHIELIRVETRALTETVKVAYSDEYVNDSSLARGTTKVLQQGSNGEKTITYTVTYENGQEVYREITDETVTVKPVNRKIARGTKASSKTSRGSSSSSSTPSITVNGVSYKYSKAMTVTSTAYTGDTITHTGMATVRNPNGYSTIAVDPTVIPFGTKLYVEGYGLAIAADSGGAVKGNMIDVFLDTYQEAYDWGIKTVKIYILK